MAYRVKMLMRGSLLFGAVGHRGDFGVIQQKTLYFFGGQGGGHGVSLDWTSLASLSSPRPWFLAGGLSSASLNRALEQCSPDGIDLNSGVEAIPGQKSPQKLLAALKPLTPYTPYHIA